MPTTFRPWEPEQTTYGGKASLAGARTRRDRNGVVPAIASALYPHGAGIARMRGGPVLPGVGATGSRSVSVAREPRPGALLDSPARPVKAPCGVAGDSMGTITSDPARLYEVDFYRWTREQAALLRKVPGERLNLPVDWNHVAEEIEDMGRSDLHALKSRIGLIQEHLLKLEHSPADHPRHGWIDTVARCRDDVSRTLDDSPSLRRKLPERWRKEYALARRRAVRGLARDGVGAAEVPADPPWTFDQVIDPDWWPASRHGHP